MKNWVEFKLIYDIQVFLDFVNFYHYFIQHFNKIATLFILMLKITILLEKLTFRQLRVSNNKVDRFDIDKNKEIIRKSENLLKSENLFKF